MNDLLPVSDPFRLSASQLQRLLDPNSPAFPELESRRAQLADIVGAGHARLVLSNTDHLLDQVEQIPRTTYSSFRQYMRNGNRDRYQDPYFLKRLNLSAVSLRLFLGESDLKDTVQDYIWDICEESNWVLPAHESNVIDLFSAETAFALAEILMLLQDDLEAEVRHRVRVEIERRIFDPYLRFHRRIFWYQYHNNWNGVCNSSIAAAFLLIEPEPSRTARALEIALAGLEVYLATAFAEDGSSDEGVAYWHYGLDTFVALAEILRARSGGHIELLASPRVRDIAAYPSKVLLSDSCFASFSDCPESVALSPGMLVRLAQRTGEASLLRLARNTGPARAADQAWRLSRMLRDMFWWDGEQHEAPATEDSILPDTGIVRLGSTTPENSVVVLKAGHNGENHNHNDIGSFIVHVDGETFLTDPGPGFYDQAYFSSKRYENIFASSYGHSVPRIGGELQRAGREFWGAVTGVNTVGPLKWARIEFSRAYAARGLETAERCLSLATEGAQAGIIWLEDDFSFAGRPAEIEEAFVTWLEGEAIGKTALIKGKNHDLQLVIEAPRDAEFRLERLEEESRANRKPISLNRFSFLLPSRGETRARVRMELTAK
jgi:hypothetical protein